MNGYPTYDWFDNDVKKYQKIIKLPEFYKEIDTPIQYKNILSDYMTIKKVRKNKISLPSYKDNNEQLVRTHRYEIKFNDKQKILLDKYFTESEKLYNICVDIWKKYNDMPTNWQIVKDVIFTNYYRSKLDNKYEDMINIIVEDIKKKVYEFSVDNEKFAEQIQQKKAENMNIYKKELELWENQQQIAKKKGVILKKAKPKMKKIKIEKEKNPRKQNNIKQKKPAPDDTLKAVIKNFCKDLKENNDRKYNNKNFKFEMKYKDATRQRHIYIGGRSMNEKGLFIRDFGESICTNYAKIFEKYRMNKETVLIYDKLLEKYYLYVVFVKKAKKVKDRKLVVALDPGEKTFLTFYSSVYNGKIGDNMRLKILIRLRKIASIQSVLNENCNKYGLGIKNKKRLKVKIARLYKNIRGYVNEIHKKAADYLCKNYENILLPTFKTKPMISNKKKENEILRISKIEDREDREKEMDVFKKSYKISTDVKNVLNMQSHYKFKKYLEAKAKEYRTTVYEVDESYTSQACTKCGKLSKTYDKDRKKKCICGYKIDRDVNGARNILLKSLRNIGKIIRS